jgi:cystathionine beta-synthase
MLPKVTIVGSDPVGSMLSQPESMNAGGVKPYLLEGPGHQIPPGVMDRSLVDKWIKTNDYDSF